MKILTWLWENSLFILALFLLVFIPLYPKLPLLDIKNTWVYIRIEDFIVAFVWLIFFVQLLRKKVTLHTPLSIPILVFWLIGGLATIHGVLFIFPDIQNAFPHLALLNFLRRVEYVSLFFLGFSAMRKREWVTPVVFVLAGTILAVFVYGIGQKLLGFPAFLTMNEEFAKGIPLRLSPLARIPATFAGHYDLAAYLTFLIPVMGSMIFGYKKWYLKIFFFLTAIAGLILLLMTQSRVSFGMYLVSIVFLLILQKAKKFIVPVIILSIVLLSLFDGISQRFASTFTQVDLAVYSRTGKAIGIVSEGGEGSGKIVIEDKQSTGENLPQGSKYINIPTATGNEFESEIIYKKLKSGSQEEQIVSSTGSIIVKKAFAYDVSFTTRFQGEWPRAVEAFKRNILFGSGYSSINLATDNNYLRMLGETGILGFGSFVLIFLFAVIYIWRLLPDIKDSRIKSLALGVIAGVAGLMLNAVLIDVFEASKVAFVLWLVLGMTLGLVRRYQDRPVNYLAEMKTIFTSIPAYLLLIGGVGIIGLSIFLNNDFVGDDFTWLRWAADCKQINPASGQCGSLITSLVHFFTDSQGFFYRPGTKSYFYLMYPLFELFPTPYHVVSLLLHITTGGLVFFLIRKLLKSTNFALVASLLFIFVSTHAEALFWISVTGHLVTAALTLFSLLMYLYWRETKHILLFVLAWLSIFVSMFFHESGTVGPFILIVFDLLLTAKLTAKALLKKWHYLLLLLPIGFYYLLRVNAQSVWFQGDYSYNLAKLPFNVIGNTVGYIVMTLVGPIFLPLYTTIRISAAREIPLALLLSAVSLLILTVGAILLRRKITHSRGRLLLMGFALFIIPLLPFLGLGNITERYVYLGSVGVIMLVVVLLQWGYSALKVEQRSLGALAIGVVTLLFLLFHYSQLAKVNTDWKKAGKIANDALVGINLIYSKPDALPGNPIFYFVNVPIRYGDAWVFSDGIENALWFSFQAKSLKVIQTFSETKPLREAKKDPVNIHVFKFESDGSISELANPTPTPLLPAGN